MIASATLNVPGAAPLPVPISATYQRQHGGPNWVRYRQTTVQATPPGISPISVENVRITGSGQFGGLWIPPQGLRQLRPGQTLDVDPITGMTTSVAQVGRTPQGLEAVTISESNQGQRVDSVYDRASGALVSVTIVGNILHAQTTFQLVGRQ